MQQVKIGLRNKGKLRSNWAIILQNLVFICICSMRLIWIGESLFPGIEFYQIFKRGTKIAN